MSYLNRSYKLQFVRDDGQSIIWQQSQDELGLAIEFKAIKSISKEPNTCEVKIYNLAPASLASVMQGGQLWLSAGYNSRNNIVFAGSITNTNYSHESGGDSSLTINTIGNLGVKDNGNSMMVLEAPANSRSGDIIAKIVNYIKANIRGVKIDKYLITTPITYTASISTFGDAWEMLDIYCLDCGYIYFIDNGTLYIQKADGTVKQPVIDVNSDSGLVGMIAQIRENDTNNKPRIGVEFTTILNPSFNISGKVRILSKVTKQLNTIYRIEALEHAGNSHSGQWISKVKAWKI